MVASALDVEAPVGGERYELSPDLVTLSDQRPSEAESIRTIRTHLIARHIRDGRRGIAVCAATPGVGCTFTATNLAVSLSQVGISTLLIDADMRNPGVETLIRPLHSTPGLRDCAGSEDIQPVTCIHSEVLPNLSIMYAGGRAENAQELLASARFRQLIDRCLRDYEFTVIDTPPASLCADARRIGSIIGYALIVARSNATRMSDVVQMDHRFQEDGTRVVGTVLSEV
ncbi:CpsD/CapB family tyrosine-protein kinase [Phenylobacterium kunshanense]|uniref:non-specific protein-tyrosine kinase n=1 Tax=Phenylobacterium kunshanense TaxID=1445034 RepID=A0A328BJE4_9CAUL|nr:CpsD/CapB family tyrosine-protein kinase [Phenylobacterium kunshanense]RAK66531.1 diutan polysaccharide export protein [Phenylobacterium kunshanense]